MNACKLEKKLEITSLFTLFERKFSDDYYWVGETHDFWELVCILDGQMGIAADRDIYSLKKYNMILHSPMEFHNLWSEGGTAPEIAVVTFQTGVMPRLPKERIFFMNEENAQLIRKIVRRGKNAFYMRDGYEILGVKDGAEAAFQVLVNELEIFLLSVLDKTVDKTPQYHDIHVDSFQAKRYSEIINIMDRNTDKILTIDALSKMCGLSPSLLKKIVAQYAGMGVMKYFNSLKVKKAVGMLREGESVKETAAKLGFEDQNYFSTVFKRIMGCPPSQYRWQAGNYAEKSN